MSRILHITGIALLLSTRVAGAREIAILRTGATLSIDRHEVSGGKVRLFSEGGFVEMPENLVERIDVRVEDPAVPLPAKVEVQAPVAVPAQSAGVSDPHALAELAARKFGLPELFVQSVMKAESGFRPGAVSAKGALGLMQLMPGTARELGVDPTRPQENAEGGAKYLRELLAKYENEPDQVVLALAAYNAGPGAVERYHGVPPYAETRQYIVRVLKEWERSKTR